VALHERDGSPGPPWDERPLRGRLDRLTVESDLLAGNPLRDSPMRPLWVYLPPGLGDEPAPSVYVIQGYTGQLGGWLRRDPWEPTFLERLDGLFADDGCRPAVVALVDAWTSLGGSQFLNSSSTGPYMDYLCEEVVPFVDGRYPTLASRHHRGLTGKSSGGYGAMVVSMERPDVFGAFASHAGDGLFEACAIPDFPSIARTLRDDFEGSWDVFFEKVAETDYRIMPRYGKLLETYAYAACYSPDPDRPGKALLPFDEHGRIVDDVWAQWLEWDPVRLAPQRLDALRSMRRIYLDAGKADEWYLDLAAQAFSAELTRGGVEHTLELIEGGHGGMTFRYPGAIRELVEALR